MADGNLATTGSVEPFPSVNQSTIVSDELNRILNLLREACPRDAVISFDFNGRLSVHVDVRKREEVPLVETILETRAAGLFHTISRGNTPNHPFFHRVSAMVDR
jgi:hypothetical protein